VPLAFPFVFWISSRERTPRMRKRFASLLLPVVAALLFVSFGACSNEGEGQPCDTNAGNGGNDDCQSPLVCTTGLNNATDPRCCPQDRANATTPECSLSSANFDGASPAPPDASTADTSSPEAASTETGTSEASTDAPAEGAVEAASALDGAAAEAGE
jgi:hypothetical protein